MQKGDVFSCEFAVTEKIYSSFMEIFHDRNPLHTDENFAKGKGFSSLVMHGNILGGFLSYFIGECLPLKNVVLHTQEIKYFRPVYLDDKLIFSAVVDEVHDSVHTVVFNYNFENEKKEKVAKGKIQIGII